MKFFIASPWRNKDAVRDLTNALAQRGYAVYSFLDSGANLATGRSVVDELKAFSQSITDWEDNPFIANIFESEMKALRECDAVILLAPAGHSSLTEAGIAYGMGKKVTLVGLVDHPEIVTACAQAAIRASRRFSTRCQCATLLDRISPPDYDLISFFKAATAIRRRHNPNSKKRDIEND
jgi:nucleoside 2-deoxyribosyltransferase